VHADSEATFLADYRTISKKLGVDDQLEGADLLDAVCDEIEQRSKWLMILDNADELKLFGVGGNKKDGGESQNLYKYVPCTSQGTVLWTSRDAHIAGTLVGASRSIQVQSMEKDEATTLLATTRGDLPILDKAGIDGLLEELQCLPLAVSQAGAYMRRMSMTAEEYLSRLKQGNSRWEVLKVSDTDRHRRPEVSNSVLETWRISTERIRAESEMSYRILHVIAYMDNQDIPHELVAVAANQFNHGSKNDLADQNSAMQVSELEVLTAVARLKEFSFLSLRQTDNGQRSYEMHKLVQEALRYGLRIHGLTETTLGRVVGDDHGAPQAEALYSGRALQVVVELLPLSEPTPVPRCEQYLTHILRVGEWAEVSGTEIATANLLEKISNFLHYRGRWRERESVDSRVWGLRREVLKERHPDTIRSMTAYGATCQAQGRYTEARDIAIKALELRQEVLGVHPDTIRSIADLGSAYYFLGQFDEAENLFNQALEYRQRVFGERHHDTIRSMEDLGALYFQQGRHDEAKEMRDKTLQLLQEMLGEKHPETVRSLANVGAIYHVQGRHTEARDIAVEVLELRQELIGERHPDTVMSIADLAWITCEQGRYEEAEELYEEALQLQKEVLGATHPATIKGFADLAAVKYQQGQYDKAERLNEEALQLGREVHGAKHPFTIRILVDIAAVDFQQGRYEKAERLYEEALQLQKEVLGEKNPDTIRSMVNLATTYNQQSKYDKALELHKTTLELRRQVLGEAHQDTISSIANIAITCHQQGKYDKALELHQTALDLRRQTLGENHPETIQSVENIASTREMLRRLTIKQNNKIERELKLWDRLFWEIMDQKVRQVWKRRSHKDQDIN
jgi:tetratricopeptide (TPR) repeat protein